MIELLKQTNEIFMAAIEREKPKFDAYITFHKEVRANSAFEAEQILRGEHPTAVAIKVEEING